MKKFIALVVSLFLLTSCTTYQDMMDKLIPKKEVKMAEDYLTKLREKDFEYIKSELSDELKPKVTDASLVQLSEHFRGGELISTEIIGSEVHTFNGIWQGNFTFEYRFVEGWNLANVIFRKVGEKYDVIGLAVYQTKMSQKELNAFNLTNKTLLHYSVISMAFFVPLFILVSLYICVLTPMPKRKWLWIIFILLGISAIRINWTTGQYAIQLLSVHLLGASASAAGPYAPWIISVSLPLGAILFWIRRKHYIELSKEANKVTF